MIKISKKELLGNVIALLAIIFVTEYCFKRHMKSVHEIMEPNKATKGYEEELTIKHNIE